MILTAGGDGASKGAQEVMQALALIDAEATRLEICLQGLASTPHCPTEPDRPQAGGGPGIDKKVIYSTNMVSQKFHALLDSRLRYLRCALAAGGFWNDPGRGQCLRKSR